ncbi:lysine methyltransferase [Pycnococcus provasolii]
MRAASAAAALAPAVSFPRHRRRRGAPPVAARASDNLGLTLEAPGWSGGYGTGGRVWLSSDVLIEFLRENDDVVRDASVVELGSGTGAVGIAAAALGARSVILSDGGSDSLVRLAKDNASRNVASGAIDGAKTTIDVAAYRWNDAAPPAEMLAAAPFDVILGSDCTYSVSSHGALCDAVKALLALSGGGDGGEASESENDDDGGGGRCRVILGHQHRTLPAFLAGRGFAVNGWGRDPHLDMFVKTARERGLDANEIQTTKLRWHGLLNVTLLELTIA